MHDTYPPGALEVTKQRTEAEIDSAGATIPMTPVDPSNVLEKKSEHISAKL